MKVISSHDWYRPIGGIGIAAVVITGCAGVPAPTEQMDVSKQAVSTAASVGGNEYASAEMRSAREKLDRANLAMTAKDYKNARLLAEQAQADAQLAISKAGSAKARKAAVAVQEDGRVLIKEMDRK